MTKPPFTIRPAVATDAEVLYQLLLAIARHHDQTEFVRTSTAQLLRDGFGDDAKFGAILAESEGRVVGYASYTWNYSMWLGTTYMNIDDVFVDESHRGTGAGEALMLEARRLCRKRGCTRVRWEVQTGNTAAIRFYERLGAKMRTKGIFSWDV